MTDHEQERRVGLGRVVEDHLATDGSAPGDPDVPDAPPTTRDGDERDVTDASAQSFPASDPPTFMSDPATPRDRDAERPPADGAG